MGMKLVQRRICSSSQPTWLLWRVVKDFRRTRYNRTMESDGLRATACDLQRAPSFPLQGSSMSILMTACIRGE
jgi:hypothetical protein